MHSKETQGIQRELFSVLHSACGAVLAAGVRPGAQCPCESVMPTREDAHSDSQQELMCTTSFMDAYPCTHFQLITGSPTLSAPYEDFWEILFLSYRFNNKQNCFFYM